MNTDELILETEIEDAAANEAAQKYFRQDWGAQLGLPEHFGGDVPEDYRTLAQAVEQKLSAKE